MRYFTEEQVRELIDVDEVISEIKAAFARDFSATVRMPPRTSLPLADGAVLLTMPCYDSALSAAGVKIVSVSQLAGVNAAYELVDPQKGLALARMEANYLTDIRTAATSAVATDLLARADAETLGIFGSGRQAVAHLTLLPRVRRFRQILVCGSGRSDTSAFCALIKPERITRPEVEIRAVDAEACARESDVICTCTTSPTPLFDGGWLRPGTHLNLVGAFQPHTREVDDETVRRARLFVDTYEGALAEAGDLLVPMRNASITRQHILGDLHEIASGKKPARKSREDITLFKSVGCALEDLVTARLIYERSQAQG